MAMRRCFAWKCWPSCWFLMICFLISTPNFGTENFRLKPPASGKWVGWRRGELFTPDFQSLVLYWQPNCRPKMKPDGGTEVRVSTRIPSKWPVECWFWTVKCSDSVLLFFVFATDICMVHLSYVACFTCSSTWLDVIGVVGRMTPS